MAGSPVFPFEKSDVEHILWKPVSDQAYARLVAKKRDQYEKTAREWDVSPDFDNRTGDNRWLQVTFPNFDTWHYHVTSPGMTERTVPVDSRVKLLYHFADDLENHFKNPSSDNEARTPPRKRPAVGQSTPYNEKRVVRELRRNQTLDTNTQTEKLYGVENRYNIPILDNTGFGYKVYNNSENTMGTCVFHALAVIYNRSVDELAEIVFPRNQPRPTVAYTDIGVDPCERLKKHDQYSFGVTTVYILTHAVEYINPHLGFILFSISKNDKRSNVEIPWKTGHIRTHDAKFDTQDAVQCIFNPAAQRNVKEVAILLQTFFLLDNGEQAGHVELMSVYPLEAPEHVQRQLKRSHVYSAVTVREWMKKWNLHPQCQAMVAAVDESEVTPARMPQNPNRAIPWVLERLHHGTLSEHLSSAPPHAKGAMLAAMGHAKNQASLERLFENWELRYGRVPESDDECVLLISAAFVPLLTNTAISEANRIAMASWLFTKWERRAQQNGKTACLREGRMLALQALRELSDNRQFQGLEALTALLRKVTLHMSSSSSSSDNDNSDPEWRPSPPMRRSRRR